MACDLTLGRKEPCKDVVGGIRAVYFTDFGDLGTITLTNDEITDMSGTFTAFKYEVKGNSSFEQNITSSRENGTTFFEQTLNLTLHKLSKEDNKELKLIAFGRPHIAVEDYNGNVFLMGREHGADVSGGTIVTGAAMGDLSGYTLTLSAMETLPANFVASPTAADPYAGMSSATVTVTVGTNS
ncbi:hypothetical protein [uncultured Mediterranean phage uvDeep1-CGR2-KM23-C896]|jgi:hypothetical protein|nr:hypothetical protein [uncultured Mediterranean phage uvDeep1-CGR2-KM23-C896]